MRYDIVSDTHGYLSDELMEALRGADVIVHAGDMCSESDLIELEDIAPVHMCLGNNDWGYEYGPSVGRLTRFFSDGLRWQICHYQERLDLETCDVAVCGHTHRPFVERDGARGALVINPGSPTYPRAGGPTIGRVEAEDGKVVSAQIVQLGDEEEGLRGLHRWFR